MSSLKSTREDRLLRHICKICNVLRSQSCSRGSDSRRGRKRVSSVLGEHGIVVRSIRIPVGLELGELVEIYLGSEFGGGLDGLRSWDRKGSHFIPGGLKLLGNSLTSLISSLAWKSKKARRWEERLVILEAWRSCGARERILRFPGFQRSGLTACDDVDRGTQRGNNSVETINFCLNVKIARGCGSTWLEAEVVGDGDSRDGNSWEGWSAWEVWQAWCADIDRRGGVAALLCRSRGG